MAKITNPPRSKKAEAWVKQETREQIVRYKKIEKAMNVELASQRDVWFVEFEQRIQKRGFNVHADIRRKIKPEEIYKKPKRKTKVVF
ncbi:MAG: hypothetical protein HOP19_26620 [Acidobacteria bacterium]|nr:hypothetical protein [Acidobacteriota bacterium]